MSASRFPHASKLSELIHFCIVNELDALCIQEHRILFLDAPYRQAQQERWTFICPAVDESNTPTGGVGILLSPLLLRMPLQILTPSPRILIITSEELPEVSFISCYAPHASASTPTNDAHPQHHFLTGLSAQLAALPTTPIIGGDMNASLPPGITGPFGYSGRLGPDAASASLELQLFLAETRLRSANQAAPMAPTFFGKFSDGSDGRVPLDHILYPFFLVIV